MYLETNSHTLFDHYVPFQPWFWQLALWIDDLDGVTFAFVNRRSLLSGPLAERSKLLGSWRRNHLFQIVDDDDDAELRSWEAVLNSQTNRRCFLFKSLLSAHRFGVEIWFETLGKFSHEGTIATSTLIFVLSTEKSRKSEDELSSPLSPFFSCFLKVDLLVFHWSCTFQAWPQHCRLAWRVFVLHSLSIRFFLYCDALVSSFLVRTLLLLPPPYIEVLKVLLHAWEVGADTQRIWEFPRRRKRRETKRLREAVAKRIHLHKHSTFLDVGKLSLITSKSPNLVWSFNQKTAWFKWRSLLSFVVDRSLRSWTTTVFSFSNLAIRSQRLFFWERYLRVCKLEVRAKWSSSKRNRHEKSESWRC